VANPNTLAFKYQSVLNNHFSGKLKKSWKKNYIVYVILIPIMIHLSVLIIYPLISSLYISFTNWSLIKKPDFTGLDNWIKLIQDKYVLTSLGVTLEYSLFYIPPVIVFALFLAALVSNDIKGITLFKAIYFLPVVTSVTILAAIWKYLFYAGDKGIANSFLSIFGIEPLVFFNDRHLALMVLAGLSVLQTAGTYMVYLLGALKGVPHTYYEAAVIDGAGRMTSFRKITLPLIKPTLLYVVILTTISSFQVFETAFMLTQGGPYYGTTTLVYYIYYNGFTKLNFGYGSAVSYLLFVIILAISIIQYKLLYSDVSYD